MQHMCNKLQRRFRERFRSRRKEKKHSYQNKTFLDIPETYDDNIIIKL